MRPTWPWPDPIPELGSGYRRDFDIGGGVPDPSWEDLYAERLEEQIQREEAENKRQDRMRIYRVEKRERRISQLESELDDLKGKDKMSTLSSVPSPSVRKMRLD